METQVIGDYCKICGDGVQLGNQCTLCKKSPFCDQCSEKNKPFKRVCNECKSTHNLECHMCNVLCNIRCDSCIQLVEKRLKNKVNNACAKHMITLFTSGGMGCYFSCKNCGDICRFCVAENGLIFKHYTCINCNSELVKKYF